MSTTATERQTSATLSLRASALADRIEEGAELLAEFAARLTDEEWLTPVTATDKRTIGVIVHHVANMYPIEIDVVNAIAAGNAVTDVTWEAVANINAAHAVEHEDATRDIAIELLKRNSREAALAVRKLSDKELDTTAPFSLSFGAPMTAQFVIEDHPLRHAWHHLARIRERLGK